MKKRLYLITILLVGIMILSGCSNSSKVEKQDSTTEETTEDTTESDSSYDDSSDDTSEEDDEEDQHAEQLHHQAPITKPTPHTARNEAYTFCPYFTIS